MELVKRGWTFNLQHILSLRAPTSRFDPPPPIYALRHFPVIFIATLLYKLILFLRPLPRTDSPHPIRVVTISDTHDHIAPNIPDGDLLIHAGDLTNHGTVPDLQAQIDWLKSLPHRQKVVIAGNHDTYLDPRSRKSLLHTEAEGELDWGDIYYLQHSEIRLEFPKRGARALHIYAAPQIPASDPPADWAFTYPPTVDAWSDTIPKDVDILITHGPPQWHLDVFGMGCGHLLREIWRVKPKLHVCGHAHTGSGYETVFWDDCQRTFELLCERNADASFFHSILSVFNWIHLITMALYGTRAVLWGTIWGGKVDATVLINAALAYQSTGKLGNPPQVAMV